MLDSPPRRPTRRRWTWTACALACGLHAQALPPSTDVFVSGAGGYAAYRIPAIETAPDGSLLAFAEGRKYNLGDPGHEDNDIDLVARRSTDGGVTWSPMRVLEDPGEKWSAANPATVVDRDTRRVWLFYLRCRPGRNTSTARPGTDDSQILARTSDDHGLTWSEPIDLTRISRDLADPKWRCTVVGPGGGIQTRSGRLILPAWRFEPWGVFALCSTDHGRTWERGELAPGLEGDECQLVELSDGQILLDVRQQKGPHRWHTLSTDGALTWSPAQPGVTVTPVCCAVERLAPIASNTPATILWTGPQGPGRSNLVARVSRDDARTFDRSYPISTGPAAYSDLAVLQDGSVGVLWERGVNRGYQFITFTRIDRSSLPL